VTTLRLAKKARLKWDAREKCWLLLYPERGLRLSETAAAIAQLCDGTRSVDEIAESLVERYATVPAEEVRADVAAFIAQLRRRGLVDDV
jgi:pyrroloquinoline quinone biosynthesis protein D